MAKVSPDKIQKEIDQQEDDNYGTGYIDGDPDKFSNTEEMVEDVTGNEIDEEAPEGFTMADEVGEAEEALEDNEDYESDEPETLMEKQEKLSSDEGDLGDE